MLSIMYEGEEYRFYDHLYAVSASGKFLRRLAPIKSTERGDGYHSLGRQRLAHRVVAFCWVENPNNYRVVHHKNNNKSDNRSENLEWLSQKQHMRHHPKRCYTMSAEHKQNLSKARMGFKSSEATKQKQRETNLRRGLRPPPPKTVSCSVEGVKYQSFKEAATELGVKITTFRHRILSNTFPEYKRLD